MNKFIVGLILIMSMLFVEQASAGLSDKLPAWLNIQPGVGGGYVLDTGQYGTIGTLDLARWKFLSGGVVLTFPVSDNIDDSDSVLVGLGAMASVKPLLKLIKIDWLPEDYDFGAAYQVSNLDSLTEGVKDLQHHVTIMFRRTFGIL